MASTTSSPGAGDFCPVCAAPFVQRARGRRRRYCSHACRQRHFRRRRDGERKRLVRLVEADARLFLPTLASGSVDLVVTDPPYRFERGSSYHRRWFAMLPDDAWTEILARLYRLLRPDAHAYVFSDPRTKPLFDAAAAAAGFRVRTALIWDKGSIGLGGCWRPQYEFINFYSKGSRPGNHKHLGNILRAPRVARGYPTEQPVAVLKTLVAQASRPGELVLDPFCGSGNVGRAARELGRRALLCDLEPGFASRRLRLAAAPPPPAAARRNDPHECDAVLTACACDCCVGGGQPSRHPFNVNRLFRVIGAPGFM